VGIDDLGPFEAEFWVLAALVLVGELFPIQVHGQVGEETFSTPFAFALLLAYGIPEVVVIQAAATLAADLIRRRPVDRIVFNLAQLAISWVLAGLALDLAGGTVRDARVALGGIATKPWRSTAAERALVGKPPSRASFRAAAEAALAGAVPREDNAFKVELAKRTLVRALEEVSA
jgi:xanthine dehydrogenase YagS FAD-binding subunit